MPSGADASGSLANGPADRSGGPTKLSKNVTNATAEIPRRRDASLGSERSERQKRRLSCLVPHTRQPCFSWQPFLYSSPSRLEYCRKPDSQWSAGTRPLPRRAYGKCRNTGLTPPTRVEWRFGMVGMMEWGARLGGRPFPHRSATARPACRRTLFWERGP
jgi:hypothetical protein